MRPSRLRRANLLLLALLVGGGGSGLPLVDAALHHFGLVPPVGAHIQSRDAASSHTERCTLGAALPILLHARTAPVRVPAAGIATSRDRLRGTQHLAAAAIVSPALPRAPPFSPV